MSDDDVQEETDEKPNWRRELEQKAEQNAARASAAERKLAVYEAGISGLNERQMKALLSTIDGDLTSDAVKAAATDLGFVKVEEKPEIPQEELDAMDRTAAATAGGGDDTSVEDKFRQEAEAAKNQEELDAVIAKYGSELKIGAS